MGWLPTEPSPPPWGGGRAGGNSKIKHQTLLNISRLKDALEPFWGIVKRRAACCGELGERRVGIGDRQPQDFTGTKGGGGVVVRPPLLSIRMGGATPDLILWPFRKPTASKEESCETRRGGWETH